jgi:large subunit ribosomal protein L15
MKNTKRLGKGAASGQGGTSGKGHKGKKARSGGGIPVWFEGGQMPIQRRLPKRGFINPTRVEYHVVQVGRLAGAPAGTTIDAAWLKSAKLVRRSGPIKLLAGGDLKVALTIKVNAASEAARKAVEAAGGKVETPRAETPTPEPRTRKTPRTGARNGEPQAPNAKVGTER